MKIREHIEQLANIPKTASSPSPEGEELITVSAATKRIAYAYERFRNVLEPDEEDILRRKAIWRILDRRLEEDKQPRAIATSLLQELIRAHYIAPVPRVFADDIARYIVIAAAVLPRLSHKAAGHFLDVVAVSIDRILYPRRLEEAMVDTMYHELYSRLVWPDDLIPEPDRPAQVYIGCHRALFAADETEIKYHFFINQFAFWLNSQATEAEIATLIRDVPAYFESLQGMLYHAGRERLLRIIRPAAVPYRILLDMIKKNDEAVWTSDEAVAAAASEAVTKRSEHIQTRITRRAWHSILFLFFTKTLVALFIELPYELFLLGAAHWLALGANIAFHPLLLLFASITVRMPGMSNTEKIIDHVKRIVDEEGTLPTIVVNKPRRYGLLTWTLFALIYTAIFMLIFWRLFLFLDQLQFSLPAILIFVVFLGLVSFLAMRIRRSVDDIRVVPKKEGAIGLFFSFLSLPILEFGRWLTSHISQLNVILFVMDLVLEAPFKVSIDIIEEWFAFVRDRKEEIV